MFNIQHPFWLLVTCFNPIIKHVFISIKFNYNDHSYKMLYFSPVKINQIIWTKFHALFYFDNAKPYSKLYLILLTLLQPFLIIEIFNTLYVTSRS
jgi:hypothetical protein